MPSIRYINLRQVCKELVIFLKWENHTGIVHNSVLITLNVAKKTSGTGFKGLFNSSSIFMYLKAHQNPDC